MTLAPPPRRTSEDYLYDGLHDLAHTLGGTAPVRVEDRPSLIDWTERYRTISGMPLLPTRIPWLRDLYEAFGRLTEVRVMKAGQVFVSEMCVNLALWACDTGQGGRGNVLYTFPTQREANDFSQARIDPPVEESPYLADRVGNIYQDLMGRKRRKRQVARVTLKRVGRGHLYLRGGDKRNQLLTVDADVLIADEAEEFKSWTIDVGRQRLNSSLDPMVRIVSTPKFPSSGIAPLFAESTRRHYHIPCGRCGLRQHLEFPGNLTQGGDLVCTRCGGPLHKMAEGEWVAENPTATVEGYHLNRLYSHRADLKQIALLGYGIENKLVTEPERIQEFFNQTLGLPHAPAGGALTDEILDMCNQEYELPSSVTWQPVTIGVDVGGVLHYVVRAPAPDQERNPGGTRLLDYGILPNTDGPDGEVWPELGALMTRYRARLCVVDALPEDERSARFCEQWFGRAFRCFYHDETQWKYAASTAWNAGEHIVHAQRTRVMDAAFARFQHGEEELPRGARYLRQLYAHLKAPVRVLVTNAKGVQTVRYQEGTSADHLAHAFVYSCVATQGVEMLPQPPDARHRKPVKMRL